MSVCEFLFAIVVTPISLLYQFKKYKQGATENTGTMCSYCMFEVVYKSDFIT